MTEQDTVGTERAPRLNDAADVHSHPLPGIDDGAATMLESVRMAVLAARYGTRFLVATPHRYWNDRENKPDLLRKLTSEVNDAIAARRYPIWTKVLPGQEIPLTPDTAHELREGRVLTIGDTGVYALVEPPFEFLPGWSADAISAIVAEGFRPVLAHPERNAIIQRDPAKVLPLVRAGALLQITAMSVTGDNREKAQNAALWMIDRGLATVIASDSHSPRWRPPTLRAAYRFLAAKYGTGVARRLCSDNPLAIATGQPLPESK